MQKLGPGFLRGDRFQTRGLVAAGAHLCVRAQAASRAFGGGDASASDAHWRVERDGFLQVIAEPLVAFDDAFHVGVTNVSLAAGARYLSLDVVTRANAAAHIALRTRIEDDTRLLAHDACELKGVLDAPLSCAGTLLFCAGDATEATYGGLAEICDAVVPDPDVRVGVGVPAYGGIFVRVIGGQPWRVRQTLFRCRTAILHALGHGALAAPHIYRRC